MNISTYQLNESDLIDFESILKKIGIENSEPLISSPNTAMTKEYIVPSEKLSETIPSIHHDLVGFQQWIFNNLEAIERFLDQYVNDGFKKVRGTVLKLHNIPNKEIQKMFNTAELIFEGFKKLEENVDASPIIIQYAKGLETILHEVVSSYFAPLLTKYRRKYFSRELCSEFHDKYGPLMLQKSISLGSWVHILRDVSKPQIYPELNEFFNYLKESFNDQTLKIIRNACEFVSDLRNPKSHNETCTMSEIVHQRKGIIKIINLVIDELYNNLSIQSLKPSITNFPQFKSWLLNRLNDIDRILEVM